MEGVNSTSKALIWIGEHLNKSKERINANFGKTKVRLCLLVPPPLTLRWQVGREALASTIFNHIPVSHFDFSMKVVFIAVILRTMIQAIDEPENCDDRDYYGNKRLELFRLNVWLLFSSISWSSVLDNCSPCFLKISSRLWIHESPWRWIRR